MTPDKDLSRPDLLRGLALVSFKLCPFVQRAAILLRHKGVAFETRYVDLNAPPDWFRAISPRGKVPLLCLESGKVLFESVAINEFLDEVTPGRLLPDDPVERAEARGWIEFATACLWLCRDLTTAPDEAAFEAVWGDLQAQLARLDESLGPGPFFAGAVFSLVDVAFAPLFRQLALLAPLHGFAKPEATPKVTAWADRLLALPEVRSAVVPDFEARLHALVGRRRGFLATLLPADGQAGQGAKSDY